MSTVNQASNFLSWAWQYPMPYDGGFFAFAKVFDIHVHKVELEGNLKH